MKRSIFILGFLMLAFSLQVQAQELKADEIINNYLQKTGGTKNWKKVSSMKMTGILSIPAQNMELPMVIYRMPENKQRIESTVQGNQIIQAYDGKDAWWINPFMGGNQAQLMPAEMASMMKDQSFEDVFIDYKQKGFQAELLGKDTVEGKLTYQIKLTKSDGNEHYYFFDAEKFFPVMLRQIGRDGQAKGQNIDTMIGNYQEVNGLVVPHYLEVRINGQVGQKITLSAVSFNEKLDEAMFSIPKN